MESNPPNPIAGFGSGAISIRSPRAEEENSRRRTGKVKKLNSPRWKQASEFFDRYDQSKMRNGYIISCKVHVSCLPKDAVSFRWNPYLSVKQNGVEIARLNDIERDLSKELTIPIQKEDPLCFEILHSTSFVGSIFSNTPIFIGHCILSLAELFSLGPASGEERSIGAVGLKLTSKSGMRLIHGKDPHTGEKRNARLHIVSVTDKPHGKTVHLHASGWMKTQWKDEPLSDDPLDSTLPAPLPAAFSPARKDGKTENLDCQFYQHTHGYPEGPAVADGGVSFGRVIKQLETNLNVLKRLEIPGISPRAVSPSPPAIRPKSAPGIGGDWQARGLGASGSARIRQDGSCDGDRRGYNDVDARTIWESNQKIRDLKEQIRSLTLTNETLKRNLRDQEETFERELDDKNASNRLLEAEIKVLESRLASNTMSEEMQKSLGEMEQRAMRAEKKAEEMTRMYREERLRRISLHNKLEDAKGKIRVCCRIRPMSDDERKRGDTEVAETMDQYTIRVVKPEGGFNAKSEFVFDTVYPPSATQENVYEQTAQLIQSAYDGFNVCIFAYGQTGSGKTFTMSGSEDCPGIVPRAVKTLYKLVNKGKKTSHVTVSCYMVELYKSRLVDLLDPSNDNKKLKIVHTKEGDVQVQGAVIREAPTEQHMLKILRVGTENRKVAATLLNAHSSRSHLILSVVIHRKDFSAPEGKLLNPTKNFRQKRSERETVGKLSFVDLAGSERAEKSGACNDEDRMKEAQSINQSLSALGNVINALTTRSKHIPHRSHVLTHLLSDSLGGNAKTLMFVNVGPSSYNLGETLNALKFATRVKMVKNAAQRNIKSPRKSPKPSSKNKFNTWSTREFALAARPSCSGGVEDHSHNESALQEN